MEYYRYPAKMKNNDLEKKLEQATAQVIKLEAEVEALRDEGHLMADEVEQILDTSSEFLDKRHAEIDAIETAAKSKLRELVDACDDRDADRTIMKRREQGMANARYRAALKAAKE